VVVDKRLMVGRIGMVMAIAVGVLFGAAVLARSDPWPGRRAVAELADGPGLAAQANSSWQTLSVGPDDAYAVDGVSGRRYRVELVVRSSAGCGGAVSHLHGGLFRNPDDEVILRSIPETGSDNDETATGSDVVPAEAQALVYRPSVSPSNF